MKRRDYRDYLRDMLESVDDIESFIGGMSFEEFKRDKKTLNAVVRSIEVVGEAAKKIARALRDGHKEIPWKEMAAMRDKPTHEYFGIDVEILWKTAKDGMPPLRQLIRNFLGELEE